MLGWVWTDGNWKGSRVGGQDHVCWGVWGGGGGGGVNIAPLFFIIYLLSLFKCLFVCFGCFVYFTFCVNVLTHSFTHSLTKHFTDVGISRGRIIYAMKGS